MAAQGEGVQQTHAKLFAGTAFALNEDWNICLRNPLQLISDSLHGGGFTENNV
jgi:hypothetical protein